MTSHAQPGLKPTHLKDLSPVTPELRLFARIENLVGDETRLLAEPLENRGQERRERLGAISQELDRIREKLRERAGRLGRDHTSPRTGS